MTPAIAFVGGVLAGLAVALCIACCRVGARTLPAPVTSPPAEPVESRPTCGHLVCEVAADIFAVRQLPEVAS